MKYLYGKEPVRKPTTTGKVVGRIPSWVGTKTVQMVSLGSRLGAQYSGLEFRNEIPK